MNRSSFFKTLLGIGVAKAAKPVKNNEAIIPLSTLTAKIRGNDLIIALNRSSKLRNRKYS